MRASPFYALLLFVALALAGCSAIPGVSSLPALGSSNSSPAPAATSPAPTTVPTPGKTAAPNANNPAVAAIQAVIQKADQEQQNAFTKNDPTLMQDTATSSYYNQLVQINSDMANGGVTSIKLVKIDWGPVKFTSSTTAQATSYETWQTTYSDGSTDQARELNVYTLVQQQGNWLIQTDDHPNANPGGLPSSPASSPTGPSSPSTSVPPASSTPATTTDVSRNWSGYAATSGTFTGVTGTWTVPQSQSSGGVSSGATWVGIGGVNSRDLIQAGTMETTDRSGTVSYQAWIETLPQVARPVNFAVKPGDSVTVTLNQQGSGQWLIQFVNHTTGETYQTTVSYASSLSSAEWIMEAPSTGRRVVPIDNFGTVQFSGGSAIENGKSVTIAQSGAQPITMSSGRGGAIVTPSVLSSDGQGFSVSESTSTAAPQFPTGGGWGMQYGGGF